MQVKCPYCHRDAELVTGQVIYPTRPSFHNSYFWSCAPCAAYVGTHKGKKHKPLGTLANKFLRMLRCKAHEAFDRYWQAQRMRRSEAYNELGEALGLPEGKCHIAMFDVETCHKVVDLYHWKGKR